MLVSYMPLAPLARGRITRAFARASNRWTRHATLDVARCAGGTAGAPLYAGGTAACRCVSASILKSNGTAAMAAGKTQAAR